MSNIREENQNPYAYRIMCFFDIASSDDEFYKYLDQNGLSGSEDIFWLLGEWIDEFDMVYSMADYDSPRYELWQEFISDKLN